MHVSSMEAKSINIAAEIRERANALEDEAARLREMAQVFGADVGKPEGMDSVQPRLQEADFPRLSRLARMVLKARAKRADFLPPDVFGEPGWNMLLELFTAREQEQRIAVTSLCIASLAPMTTAMRWLDKLVASDLAVLKPSTSDGRVIYVELSRNGFVSMQRYFRTALKGI